LPCPILIVVCPEYVQRFATKEAADAATDSNNDDDADEEMSDMGSISENEDHMEP